MKDYLNRKELETTAVVLCSKEIIRAYLQCEYLAEEEVKLLRQVVKNLDKLQTSLFKRTESVYLKRLKSIVLNNELYFAPKGLTREKIAEEVDDEIVEKLLKDSGWAMECIDCEKQDYKNCNCYKIYASIGKEPSNCNKQGCPFL